ncbi:cytochrome c oxidase assembly protein COX11, mitochondrial isoform X3 [Narcine bancroftii]|uniref:cytochrome c oxidase assembly protein COX11, mitochondrial isoform X3 n=1 Tax=Narcine bancroftii TaxID=1343680 RepID=UPI0038322443
MRMVSKQKFRQTWNLSIRRWDQAGEEKKLKPEWSWNIGLQIGHAILESLSVNEDNGIHGGKSKCIKFKLVLQFNHSDRTLTACKIETPDFFCCTFFPIPLRAVMLKLAPHHRYLQPCTNDKSTPGVKVTDNLAHGRGRSRSRQRRFHPFFHSKLSVSFCDRRSRGNATRFSSQPRPNPFAASVAINELFVDLNGPGGSFSTRCLQFAETHFHARASLKERQNNCHHLTLGFFKDLFNSNKIISC